MVKNSAATDWLAQEMKYLELGEKRLEKRLLKIISDFSQNPTAAIAEFCGDWAATKATYAFLKNPTGGSERILFC